jgi:hypothetical protein
MSKMTVHPLSQSLAIDSKEWDARPGRMWPLRALVANRVTVEGVACRMPGQGLGDRRGYRYREAVHHRGVLFVPVVVGGGCGAGIDYGYGRGRRVLGEHSVVAVDTPVVVALWPCTSYAVATGSFAVGVAGFALPCWRLVC